MKSSRRRQVHFRHRGHPNRRLARVLRQTAQMRSRALTDWPAFDLDRLATEFRYFGENVERETLRSFMLLPEYLPYTYSSSYLPAMRQSDEVVVLRQSECVVEEPRLRYYGEIE